MFSIFPQYGRLIVALGLILGLSFVFFRLLRPLLAQVPWLQARLGINSILSLVLGLAFSVSTLLALAYLYVYYGFDHQPDIYRHGPRDLPIVALTFDDGPSPEFTPPILDILREYGVPATFFMVGSHVEKYPEIAQRIVDEGHEIGNHTLNHRNVPTLSTLDLHEEVVGATTIITEVTGEYPTYIRPPRGFYDGRFRRLAAVLGQQTVLWTISSRDWRYGTTADAIVKNVMGRVRNGDIILFHDSGALVKNEGGDRSATVKALPIIIERLQARGLQIVPLRVLLYGEEPQEKFPSVDMQE
ncbi:MAG: polysaccharide deacetylase family protein [Firmicutes bacterium]|nr:polysaccharide deacetylase family protein [Bacillota bacterium]